MLPTQTGSHMERDFSVSPRKEDAGLSSLRAPAVDLGVEGEWGRWGGGRGQNQQRGRDLKQKWWEAGSGGRGTHDQTREG